MDVRWSERARRDALIAVVQRMETDVDSGIRLAAALEEAFQLVSAHPDMGRPEPGGRSVLVQQFRCHYKLHEGTVVVRRVWDTRRNPDDFAFLDE